MSHSSKITASDMREEGKPLKSLSSGEIDSKLFRLYVSMYPLSYSMNRTSEYIQRYVNLINTNDDDDVYPCKYACCYSSRKKKLI